MNHSFLIQTSIQTAQKKTSQFGPGPLHVYSFDDPSEQWIRDRDSLKTVGSPYLYTTQTVVTERGRGEERRFESPAVGNVQLSFPLHLRCYLFQ
ncbi:hypothetical protein PoB_003831100 [Plakobranchus ocellatus]|uniref:Uncharacterized protein n=1 Tax=Plakobranchus ocellatus TaxID=259542 RepID=A0AAV4AZ53_9GAST|nr:hypothetical protein PoB_003831100 [Plakobranchus ocellatus]